MTRFLLLFLLPLLAGGGAIAIENDGFRATFADPSDETLGFRFFRAGWVRGLYPAAGETSLFHTRTLFDYHRPSAVRRSSCRTCRSLPVTA